MPSETRWCEVLGARPGLVGILLVALLTSHAPAAAPAGAAMITLRATVERLGSIGPDIHSGAGTGVDAGPVVLWSGTQPAAVLALGMKEGSKPNRVSYRLEQVGGSAPSGFLRRGPLEFEAAPPRGKDGYEYLDRLHRIFAADFDGDGTDELVLLREFGGVQVFTRDRVLFESPSPTTPEMAHYMFKQWQRVREGTRDSLYLFFERYARGATGESGKATPGAPDPFRLLRIDAAGVHRVALVDTVPGPSAFAVLTKAGGALDAIALFGWKGETGLLASLHDGDGRRIGGPWQPGVPSAPGGFNRVVTAPGRRLAAATLNADGGNMWLLDFEGERLRGGYARVESEVTLLHVAADGPEPLVMAAAESWNWALDAKGKPWHRPDGSWKPCPPKSWLDVDVAPPGTGFERPRIFPAEDGSDQYLVLHARPRHDRKLTHAEVLAAAKQFLPEAELADLEVLVPPAEAGQKKEDDVSRHSAFDREVTDRLTWPLRHPESVASARYRNPDAFRAWLAENDLHAKTVLTLVRGGRLAARFEVAGYNDRDERTEVGASEVAWRAEGGSVTVVLSLKTADTTDPRKEEARFHIVRAAP